MSGPITAARRELASSNREVEATCRAAGHASNAYYDAAENNPEEKILHLAAHMEATEIERVSALAARKEAEAKLARLLAARKHDAWARIPTSWTRLVVGGIV